jgi:hypothetical protein
MANGKRTTLSPTKLDQYLTGELHKTPGFEAVDLSAGYRLRGPDVDGCNWSGDVIPIRGMRAPAPERIADALRPIIRAARARFNLSE